MIKKIINTTLIATGLFFIAITRALAVTTVSTCPTDATFSNLCRLSSTNLGEITSKIIVILLIFAVLASTIFLIWGGIKWITSGGDKTAVEGARNNIIAAVIGLVVSFSAFFIINIIAQIFLGKDILNLTLPTLSIGTP